MSEQAKTDADQYADAFDQAVEGIDFQPPKDEERSQGGEDGIPQAEGKGEEDAETKAEDKQETEDSKDAGSSPKSEPSDEDFIKDPAKLLQQFKSLKGTYNWAEKQRRDLESKLKERESGAGKPTDQPKESAEKSTIEDDDDIKFLKEEYPDVYKGMSKIVEKARKETEEATLKTVLSTLAPLIIRDKETAEEKHFKAIEVSHEDYEELSSNGAIDAWIDQQPAYKAKAYRNVVEQGSSDEVIDLINDYKKDSGIDIGKPRNGQPKAKKSNPLETGEGVSAGRRVSAVKTPAKSSGNDYENAFNEAVSGIR